MQNGACFRCHQQGHWVRDCPLNSSNPNSRALNAQNHGFPNIYCRCGHGFCEVKESKNVGNYLRSYYYFCPIKRGKKCRTFIWCDDPDDKYFRPPHYKYPLCSCGAGVCRKEKENSGPNQGRYFFACPIREEHGGCDYHKWEDTLLPSPSIVPDQQQQGTKRTLLDFSEANHIDKTNVNGSGNDNDSPCGPSKRMKTTGDFQSLSEVQEREDAILVDVPMERGNHIDESTKMSTPPNADFPEFKVEDDLDISVSWDDVEENARSSLSRLHRLSSPSRIHSRQEKFQRDIAVADGNCDECFGKTQNDLKNVNDLKNEYEKNKTLLEKYRQRCQSLRDEAFGLKNKLHEVEERLNSCEQEKLKVEIHLGEINTRKMEAEKSLKIIAAEKEAIFGENQKN